MRTQTLISQKISTAKIKSINLFVLFATLSLKKILQRMHFLQVYFFLQDFLAVFSDFHTSLFGTQIITQSWLSLHIARLWLLN